MREKPRTVLYNTPGPSPWVVRPYREGDIPGILALFADAGMRPRSVEEYRWQVLDHAAPAPTAWVAEMAGRVVGHYSGTPVPLQLHGMPVRAIHATSAVTAPDFRRRGVISAVASTAAASWKQAGFQLQIGLPWGSWGSRRDWLGWVPLVPMVWMRRWLVPEEAVARRARLPALGRRAIGQVRVWDRLHPDHLEEPPGDITIRQLSHADRALDHIWECAGQTWSHLVIRNRRWVAWRYFTSPAGKYQVLLAEREGEPVGYLVLRLERRTDGALKSWIVDLFTGRDDVDARRALLLSALRRSRQFAAESVSVLVLERSAIQVEVAAAGFKTGKGGDFCIVPFDSQLHVETLRGATDWLLVGGDFDVV